MNPEGRQMLPGIAFRSFVQRFQEPALAEGIRDITTVNFEVPHSACGEWTLSDRGYSSGVPLRSVPSGPNSGFRSIQHKEKENGPVTYFLGTKKPEKRGFDHDKTLCCHLGLPPNLGVMPTWGWQICCAGECTASPAVPMKRSVGSSISTASAI